MMMTWARKDSHILAGSFFVSDTTYPLLTSLTVTPLTLNPTLSPGWASYNYSWWISMDLTSALYPDGVKVTFIPTLRIPVSTLPTGTVPTPEIL